MDGVRLLDLDRLLAEPPAPIDWAWDGYVERGTVAQLHGDGGVGKSILALALARAMVDAQPFLGRDTFPLRVAVIDGENPKTEIHRRLSRFAFEERTERLRYAIAEEPVFPADDPARVEAGLVEFVQSEYSEVLILDSQRALWGGEENEAREVRRLYGMLRRVANATAAAIIVVHHDNKAGGYSGSTDLNASVDSRMHLVRGAGGVTVVHEKCRSGPRQPDVTYRLSIEGGRYAFALIGVDTSDLDERVKAYLTEHPDAASNEVVSAVKGNRSQVLKLVKRFRDAGTTQAGSDKGGTTRNQKPRKRRSDAVSEVVPTPRNHSEPSPEVTAGGSRFPARRAGTTAGTTSTEGGEAA